MSIILVIALVIILLLLAWALFGSRGAPAEIPEKKAPAENDEPERVLRRRASDRAIEREFPEGIGSADIPCHGTEIFEWPQNRVCNNAWNG